MESENVKEREELDLTSPHFNAERVLFEPEENVRVPEPNTPLLDNISCFIETEDGIFPKKRKLPAPKKKDSLPSTSTDTGDDMKKENEETTAQKRKSRRNVLTRMNEVKGPLGFLKKCMDEKRRIKVYTRGPVNVRGFCLGYLEAFDKHWNLVMKDVFEEWTRRRKTRRVRMDEDGSERKRSDQSGNDVPGQPRVNLREIVRKDGSPGSDEHGTPKTVVKKKFKKKEICERHVDQMLIRGEQIVLVTLASS